MKLQLVVKTFMENSLINTYKKDEDVLLNNFGKWLAAHFKATSNTTIVTLKNTSGVDVLVKVMGEGSGSVPSKTFNNGAAGNSIGLKGGIVGSGGQAASNSDFNLMFFTAGPFALSPSPSYSNGVISLGSFNYTPAFGENVREVGLLCSWMDSTSIRRDFLLTRDTFGTITGTTMGGSPPTALTINFAWNLVLS